VFNGGPFTLLPLILLIQDPPADPEPIDPEPPADRTSDAPLATDNEAVLELSPE
jgi:hypothetical protein